MYFVYINPLIRFFIVGWPVLYVYSLASAFLTYRHNAFVHSLQQYLPYDVSHPFRLPDIFHTLLPTPSEQAEQHWRLFTDTTPVLLNVLFVCGALLRRDIIRFAEFFAIQMTLLTLNAAAHAVTTFPDPFGQNDACQDRLQWDSRGFHWFTTEYCGDMMFSGHTLNTIVAAIMIRRLLYDVVGWRTHQQMTSIEYEDINGHPHWNRIDCEDLWTLFHHFLVQKALTQQRSDVSEQTCIVEMSGAVTRTCSTEQASLHRQFEHETQSQRAAHESSLHSSAELTAIHQHDMYMIVTRCPYVTPSSMRPQTQICLAVINIIRLLLFVWTALLLFAIVYMRYHYSVDVLIAVYVSLLVTHSSSWLQFAVRWLYRPNYTNYLHPSWYQPVHVEPLNQEQINYEERCALVGATTVI